ncbi:MAG: type II toxin-antitoxin system RelE/ParE family toxin [Deltaproteobacteria bacterium]|jgi:phage-related protein
MPEIDVVLFKEKDGSVPLIDWLDRLPEKARIKCLVRIERLSQMGNELRRPEADYLEDRIYELRVSLQGINYRMLYFFHEKRGVLSHGLVKESRVPPNDFDIAIKRKAMFEQDPDGHTYREERQ